MFRHPVVSVTDLCHQFLMSGRGQVADRALAASRHHAGRNVNVDGRLGQTVKQKLLVDNVLSWREKEKGDG